MPNLCAAIPLGEAGMTVLIGLVVVFAALIVLTFIFWLFGRVNDTSGHKKPEVPAAKVAPAPAMSSAPVASSAPAATGIDPAVVAAISAAVACMAPAGTRYALRSVRPSGGQRPVWAQAGLTDATRPF